MFGGGNGNSDVMDYVTIATPGNATDFGNLTVARNALGATTDGARGVFGGGYSNARIDVLDYITIASTGNATDFGNLTVARNRLAGTSGT